VVPHLRNTAISGCDGAFVLKIYYFITGNVCLFLSGQCDSGVENLENNLAPAGDWCEVFPPLPLRPQLCGKQKKRRIWKMCECRGRKG
jgi:hypothetical protein